MEKRRGKSERGGGGRMGQGKKCRGGVLASDKGISVPPVGQSESLKL